MPLRRYREGDGEALARLMVAAFGDAIGYAREYFDPDKNPRLEPAGIFVIEEDGEARESATVLPLEALSYGIPAPMGGLAAVLEHPAYRRRGYAGELMRAVLAEMRGSGKHL